MRRTLAALVVCALALALPSLAACAGQAPETVRLGGSSASPASQETVERPWGTVRTFPELEKAEIPGEPDMTFAAEMIMHHGQAIELSRNVLAHEGLDERVAAAARFIEQDQRHEIATMNAWIDAWKASLPELAHGGHDHGHDQDHDGASMPGMVPKAEVERLRDLASGEAQVSFLELMIEHHEGAVTMSQDYLGQDQNTFTRSIAQHIIREQTVEITYLRRLADELRG